VDSILVISAKEKGRLGRPKVTLSKFIKIILTIGGPWHNLD
jgi:hypothetical protein